MSAAEVKDEFIITDGPGALPLLVSLVEPNSSPRKGIMLDAGVSQFEVCITFLAQATSTGEELHFEGWLRHSSRGNIHGYYSTRTRKGWFRRGHKYSFAADL